MNTMLPEPESRATAKVMATLASIAFLIWIVPTGYLFVILFGGLMEGAGTQVATMALFFIAPIWGHLLLLGYWRLARGKTLGFPTTVFWILSLLFELAGVLFFFYVATNHEAIALIGVLWCGSTSVLAVRGILQEAKTTAPRPAAA